MTLFPKAEILDRIPSKCPLNGGDAVKIGLARKTGTCSQQLLALATKGSRRNKYRKTFPKFSVPATSNPAVPGPKNLA